MTKSANLSDVDKVLLRALQRDGRATNGELASITHMSESACLRRVKSLELTGVIERYAAIVNPVAVGRPLTVFITLSLVSQAREALAEFERAIALISDVQECHLMAGTSDYIIRVAVRDVEELEQFHSQVLTRLPGVTRVVSNLVLRSVIRRTSMSI